MFRLHEAQSSIENRDENIDAVVLNLEKNLELLGLTGVEDKLQENVKQTLEIIRYAGIKIWMLTGDKRETATCIGISSKLISRNQFIFQMESKNENEAKKSLEEFSSLIDTVLVIDGDSLYFCLQNKEISEIFFHCTKNAPSVICCRCSPTQKAQVVELIRNYSPDRLAAIGDGGNDVSMIQAAHVGFGIEGKEGRQAALAADYSLKQFSHIGTVLLYHGRNSYHRSASISQIIAHRGMIISFIQAIYSAVFYFSPTTLYTGMLIFGYSCWYTFFPVFALVTDRDLSKENALLYPELYQESRKGLVLSYKTFTLWSLISLVQAVFIFFITLFLIDNPINYIDFVSITFSALIFIELLNVVLVIKHWNQVLLFSIISTAAIYPLCMIILSGYYRKLFLMFFLSLDVYLLLFLDITYISTWNFWWKTFTVTIFAILPVFVVKKAVEIISPRSTLKIS